jgi:NAD(P)H-dependent FMN reductase
MSQSNILVFAGSCRRESMNLKLARAAARLTEVNASATLIDLADYPAPIYNGDDEAADGMPESIVRFRQLLREHHGFIVATPEYNGHVPPLLVNTLAWASRTAGDTVDDDVFAGKSAAVMAASPGRLGGVRVIPRMRDFLAELGVTVVPGFATIPAGHSAFDDAGDLKDDAQIATVQGLIDRLIAHC